MKECKLALNSSDHIVAFGKIIEENLANPTIHGVPLGKDNVKVQITVAIEAKAKVPIPVRDDILTVNDAVGSIVAWPKSLVVLTYVKVIIVSNFVNFILLFQYSV